MANYTSNEIFDFIDEINCGNISCYFETYNSVKNECTGTTLNSP
jgi:hypothetical protein